MEVAADSKGGEKPYVGGAIQHLQSYKTGLIISILKRRKLSPFEGSA